MELKKGTIAMITRKIIVSATAACVTFGAIDANEQTTFPFAIDNEHINSVLNNPAYADAVVIHMPNHYANKPWVGKLSEVKNNPDLRALLTVQGGAVCSAALIIAGAQCDTCSKYNPLAAMINQYNPDLSNFIQPNMPGFSHPASPADQIKETVENLAEQAAQQAAPIIEQQLEKLALQELAQLGQPAQAQ